MTNQIRPIKKVMTVRTNDNATRTIGSKLKLTRTSESKFGMGETEPRTIKPLALQIFGTINTIYTWSTRSTGP